MDPLSKNNFDLIPTKDAAKLSGYTSDYLARLARSGKIVGKKIGHSWFVNEKSLSNFLDQQGERKVDYARTLSRSREAEYRAHHSPIRQVLKTSPHVVQPPIVSRFDVAKSKPRPHVPAFAATILIMIAAAAVAQSPIIPKLAEQVAAVAQTVSLETSIAAQSPLPFTAAPVPLSSVHIEPSSFVELPASSRGASSLFANTQGHSFATFAFIPVPVTTSPRIAAQNVRSFARTTYSFIASPPRILNVLVNGLTAFGTTIIDATHVAIHTDAAFAYAVAEDAPLSARDFVSFISNIGGSVASAAARVPALAAAAYIHATGVPATLAPDIAAAVFNTEYTAATHFVAFTNTVTAQYLALVSDTGRLAYSGTATAIALAHPAIASLAAVPTALENAYLGVVGKSALAMDSLDTQRASALAAALPALSAGEQAALFTYQTVQGLFNSAAGALTTLFGSTKNVEVVSNPPQTVLPFASSTVPSSTSAPTQPTSSPTPAPAVAVTAPSPAPPPASTPVSSLVQRVSVTSYPTYTTVVNGASEDFVNQSLAALRTSILATVAGMVGPVAAQTATNVTSIQQVNMIQDLSNLIVRNGDFLGGTFSGGSVTANSLSVSGTGTTTIAGPIDAAGGLFVNGVQITGTGGSGNVNSGTAGELPYYAANGITLTATPALVLSAAGDFGIGTTSPTSKLSIYTAPGEILKNPFDITSGGVGGGTTLFNVDDQGVVTVNSVATSGFGYGSLVLNASGVTPPTIPHNDSVHIIGAANAFGALYIDSFGDNADSGSYRSLINLRAARGTPSAPAANQTGDELGRIAGRGYDGSAFTGSLSAISFYSAETLTTSAQGSYMSFRTTPIGSVGGGSYATPPEVVRIQPSGGVSVGDATFNATDPGHGSLAISGNLGIGTSSPYAALSVAGASGVVANIFTATSTMATSTFANGINLTGGCVEVNGACLTGGGGGSGTVGAGTTGYIPYYAGSGTTLTATSSLVISAAGSVGIGTTSPYSTLGITSNADTVTPLAITGHSATQTGDLFDISLNSGGPNLYSFSPNGLTITGNVTGQIPLFINQPTSPATMELNDGSGGPGAYVLGEGNCSITTWGSCRRWGFRKQIEQGIEYSWGAIEFFDSSGAHNGYAMQFNPNGGTIFGGPAHDSLTQNISSGVQIGNATAFPSSGDLGAGTLDVIGEIKTDSTLIASSSIGVGTTSPYALLSVGNTNGIGFTTATSTFNSTGGINLASGCFAVNGVCVGGGGGAVSSVSNTDNTLTISPTTGSVVASLNLAHANTFTGLQQFNANASTSQLTVTGNAYFPGSGIWKAGGSVGIGTTSPAYPLEISTGPGQYGFAQTAGTHTIASYVDNTGGWLGTTSNDPFFIFTNNGSDSLAVNTNGRTDLSATGSQLRLIGSPGNSFSLVDFSLNATGGLTINSTGSIKTGALTFGGFNNVGIGTTSPYSMLSVAGQVVAQNFVATSTLYSSTFAGKVGIGNSSPVGMLDVKGDSSGNAALIVQGGSNFFVPIQQWKDYTGVVQSYVDGTGNIFTNINGNSTGYSQFGPTPTEISFSAPAVNLAAVNINTSNISSNAVNAVDEVKYLNASTGVNSAVLGRVYYESNANLTNTALAGGINGGRFVVNIGSLATSTAPTISLATGVSSGFNDTIAPASIHITDFANFNAESSYPVATNIGTTTGFWMKSGSSLDGFMQNTIGLRVDNLITGTKNYAVYTEENAGTNNYAVYTGGTAKSYFGGSVGIGTSSPYAALSVVGQVVGSYFTATSATATSTFASGIQITSPVGDYRAHPQIEFQSGYGFEQANATQLYTVVGSTPVWYFGGTTMGANQTSGPLLRNTNTSTTTPGFAFNGDTSTGIGRGYAGELSFINNGSASMNILPTGNVGIGTTSPWATLSVNGNSDLGNFALAGYFTATSTTATSTFANGINLTGGCFEVNGACVTGTGGSGTVNSGIAGQFPYYAANGTTLTATSSLFVTSSGNVGIGTTTSQFPLTVSSSSARPAYITSSAAGDDTLLTLINTDNSWGDTAALRLSVDYPEFSGDMASIFAYYSNVNPGMRISEDLGNPIYFNIGNNGSQGSSNNTSLTYTKMTLTSTGLGIGTTSPYAALSVVGQAVASYFTATSTTATSTFAGGVNVGSGNGYFVGGSQAVAGDGTKALFGFSNTTGSTGVAFGTNDTATGGAASAFGIGNDATNTLAAAFGYTNSAGGSASVAVGYLNNAFADGSIAIGANITNTTPNSLQIGPSNSAKLTISSSGDVSIGGTGTSTIAHNLDVLGTLHATNSYVGDLIFKNDFRFTEGALNVSPQTLNLENQFGSTTVTFTDTGAVGIGTTAPSAKLTVSGNVFASSYEASPAIATSFSLGSTTVTADLPSSVLTASGNADLYKLATYTLSGVQALEDKVNTEDIRITSLEARVAALESGAVSTASGSPVSFSTSSLASALGSLGVLVEKGVATFAGVVTANLTVGSGAHPTGVTMYDKVTGVPYCFQIANGQSTTTPGTCSTVVADTSTSPTTPTGGGTNDSPSCTLTANPTTVALDDHAVLSWTATNVDTFSIDQNGQSLDNTTPADSGTTTSKAITGDTVFTGTATSPLGKTSTCTASVSVLQGNAPIIQSDGGNGATTNTAATTTTTTTATSTPSSSSSDTTPPVVTLGGAAAMQITVGDTFTDPGATATDNVDGDLTSKIVETGSVDTTTVGLYTLTYAATDAAGNTGSVSRVVTVLAPPPPPPPSSATTTPTTASSTPSTP